MAETTKKTTTNAETKKERTATVRLPRRVDQKDDSHEFFSVNFKTYRVQKGVPVEVPEALAEVIENNELAEEYALRYIDENAQRVPEQKL